MRRWGPGTRGPPDGGNDWIHTRMPGAGDNISQDQSHMLSQQTLWAIIDILQKSRPWSRGHVFGEFARFAFPKSLTIGVNFVDLSHPHTPKKISSK